MKTRARIYIHQVDPRVCYARGRGFAAYVRFCKEAVENSKKPHGVCVCHVEGNKIYEPNTMVQLA